jgi:iron complex outermembrane receptor protein
MPRASASGTSDSVRGIQLRGLAPDQVLVLVNGKRRHANAVMDIEGLFPGTVAVDVNAIPGEAIDHIEILRDGAGAMYGSDAIAGVVNIVLKSGGRSGGVDTLYGANYTHFAPTDSTITDGRSRLVSADVGLHLGSEGAVHFGAEYRDTGATNRAGPTSASASYNSTPADLALNNHIVFASGDPATINKSLFYNASLPVIGGEYEAYSFATANWRHTWGDAFFRYPDDPTNVPSIYPSGYRPVSEGVGRDASVVAGLRSSVAGWKWDVSAREGYDTFSYGLANTLNASLGASSPTTFHVADFTYEERALNLDLARAVPVPVLSAPLNVSLGAEYMHGSYHTSRGDPASYAAGPFTYDAAFGEAIPPGSQGDNGLSPQDVVHLARHVSSLYVDLDDDLTSRLLLGLAGRYSDYSDYGSSWTGKFEVRYKITEDFLVRGSASNSFRAPALAQEGIRITTLNFNTTGTRLQNTAFLPPTTRLAEDNGGSPLRPETSMNYTAGFAWRGPASTSATLDLYQIKIRNRITPTGNIPVSDPNYPDIAAVTFLTNGLDTTTRGLDAVLSHTHVLGGGELKVSAAFNRNYVHQDALHDALANFGRVNEFALIPLEYGTPTTKLILSVAWAAPGWGLSARSTRYGIVYANSFDPTLPTIAGVNVQKYSPAWATDAEVRFDPLASVRIAVGGTDIFNRYPDRTTPLGAYYGAFPYNFANPLGLNGAFYYLRASWKFAP